MKKFKKLISIMLTVVMALAMSMTAFAADGDKPTQSGGKYNIYQIFTGEYHQGLLSNVKWGKNGTGTEGEKVTKAQLESLEKLFNANENEQFTTNDVAQLKEIEKWVNIDSQNAFIKETTATTHTVPAGYYLVSGTVNFSDGQSADTLYVVRVTDGNLTFQPKVDVPTVEKKIVDENRKVDVNEASIGDDVTYEITGTLPSNFDVYKTYTYLFTDTLSKGLSYNNDIAITVDGVDVTRYFGKSATTADDTKITTIKAGMQDLKQLNNLEGVTVTATSKIVIRYSAKLTGDAVIAGAGNTNDVLLNYTNNPNDSGEGTTEPPTENPDVPEPPTGVTPKDEVVTFTTELAVLKIQRNGADDTTNEILQGAEFTLTGNGVKVGLVSTENFVNDTEGEYWKLANGSYTTMAPVTEGEKSNVEYYDLDAGKFRLERTLVETSDPTKTVATIDADGRVTFTGLGAGTYTLSESNTPDGFNTAEPITFIVSFDPSTKTFSANNGISLGANNTLETTVVNQKGSLLPSTGGIGTTIFYIVGAILVIGAGIILVAKKRMSQEQ